MKRIVIAVAAVALSSMIAGTPGEVLAGTPSNAARQIPAGLTVVLKVKNFSVWKAVYDRESRARSAAGIRSSVVMREWSGQRRVIVHIMGTNKSRMMRYVNSNRVGKLMRGAGVMAKPIFIAGTHMDLNPPTKREGTVAGGVVGLFEVRDFGKWMRIFKSGAKPQRGAGIIAHLVARGTVGKRTRVVAMLAGTNRAVLKRFVESKETARAMAKGTVIGKAELIYVDVVDTGSKP